LARLDIFRAEDLTVLRKTIPRGVFAAAKRNRLNSCSALETRAHAIDYLHDFEYIGHDVLNNLKTLRTRSDKHPLGNQRAAAVGDMRDLFPVHSKED